MKHFYEDIFRVIGEFGRWQMKRVAVLWWFMFLIGLHNSTWDYMDHPVNEFFCDLPQCSSYDTSFFVNKTTSLKDKVLIFNYSNIWPRLDVNYPNNYIGIFEDHVEMNDTYCTVYAPKVDANGKCNWNFKEGELKGLKLNDCPPGPGNNFHYNPKLKIQTAMTYFGLHCDNKFSRNILSYAIAAGGFTGSIVVATIMPKLGRRILFMFSITSMALGSILSCFNNFYFAYLPGSFLWFGGCLSLYQVNLIYLVEIVGLRKQVFSRCQWFTYNSLIGASFLIPYYTGKLVAGVFIEVISLDFSIYCILLAVLSSLSTSLVYFLPESPRWLLVTYRTDDARKVLEAIAEENKEKIEIKIEVVEKKKDYDVDGARLKNYIKIIFNDDKYEEMFLELRSYKWRIIICSQCSIYTIAFIWCGILSHINSDYIKGFRRLNNDSRIHNLSHISLLHFGLNLLGVLIVMLLEGKLGRRNLLLLCQVFMSVSNIFCQIIMQAHPEVVSDDERLSAIYYIHSCQIVGNSIAIVLLIWFALSVYPTAVRGVFLGITFAYQVIIKTVSVPILAWLIKIMEMEMEIYKRYDPRYTWYINVPYIPFSLGYLIAAIACYYLPEILHVPPPDTLDDVTLLQKRTIKYPNYNQK